MAGEEAAESPKILPEAAIARLREAAPRFDRMAVRISPFTVGELVTPRKDGLYGGAGEPCIIVETRAQQSAYFNGPSQSGEFGAYFDTRIIRFLSDSIVALWVEGAHFGPYTGEGA